MKAMKKQQEGMMLQDKGLAIVEAAVQGTALEELTPVFQGLAGMQQEALEMFKTQTAAKVICSTEQTIKTETDTDTLTVSSTPTKTKTTADPLSASGTPTKAKIMTTTTTTGTKTHISTSTLTKITPPVSPPRTTTSVGPRRCLSGVTSYWLKDDQGGYKLTAAGHKIRQYKCVECSFTAASHDGVSVHYNWIHCKD